jgi:ribonuclease BN (tRNA processing enzyme)
MRLTVLGSAGTMPGPMRACASYLVEQDGYRLLLDCGNGSLGNLLQVVSPADIDAVLISHQHLDHWADLFGLYYARWFDDGCHSSVPVYGPRGLADFISQVLPPGDSTFRDVCAFEVASAGDRLELGPLAVTLHAANHPVETLMSRVEADGVVLTYSADTAPTDELVRAAGSADLLIADATWRGSPGLMPPGVHMTASQAGEHAQAAGARRLLASHLLASHDPRVVAADASACFDGPVTTAQDLWTIDLAAE